jgi:hypothetical protein
MSQSPNEPLPPPQYWQAPRNTPATGAQAQSNVTQRAHGNPAPQTQNNPYPPSALNTFQTSSILSDPDLRQDAQAALGAYEELGRINPEYEDAVIDSFLERVDQRLAQRARFNGDEQLRMQPPPIPPQVMQPPPMYVRPPTQYPFIYQAPYKEKPPTTNFAHVIATVALILGFAIPLTAIAAELIGFLGFIIAWIGISAVGEAAFRALSKGGREPLLRRRRKELM